MSKDRFSHTHDYDPAVGLARHTDPSIDEGLRTWQWLAPEILNFERVEYDERSDVYRHVLKRSSLTALWFGVDSAWKS